MGKCLGKSEGIPSQIQFWRYKGYECISCYKKFNRDITIFIIKRNKVNKDNKYKRLFWFSLEKS